MIDESRIQILAQLLEAMDESVQKLEEYYNKKDIENFNKYKKAIAEFQAKINKVLENGS